MSPAGGATRDPGEVQAPPPGVTAPTPPPAIAAEPGAGTAQPEPVAESATQEVGARGEPEVTEIQAQLIDLFDRADQAIGDARYATAAAAYQSILRLDPSNTDAREGLATANSLAEQRALRQIDELLAQAQAAFERGDLEAARSRYEDVLDIDPGYGAAAEGVRAVTTAEEIAGGGRQRRIDELLETALAAFDRGDVAATRDAYEEVLALDPTHTGASEGLEAVTAAEEIVGIRQDPQD